jgi:Sec-independent protein translocase protein TatA
MNFMGVGGLELLVILVLAMLVLGPGRLASTARTLGRLTRELRRGAEDLPGFLEELSADGASNSGAPRVEEQNTEPAGSQPRNAQRHRPNPVQKDGDKT